MIYYLTYIPVLFDGATTDAATESQHAHSTEMTFEGPASLLVTEIFYANDIDDISPVILTPALQIAFRDGAMQVSRFALSSVRQPAIELSDELTNNLDCLKITAVPEDWDEVQVNEPLLVIVVPSHSRCRRPSQGLLR